jgi:fibronectin-binding autotransporter adhesin
MRNILIHLLFTLFVLLSIGATAQTIFTSASAGPNNWSVNTTWTQSGPVDADGVPDAGDFVTIATGHTVNITAASACSTLAIEGNGILAFTANVTLAAGTTLTMDGTSQITGANAAQILTVGTTFGVLVGATNARISGITFTVNGTSSVAGTITLNSNVGVKTFIGAVTNSGSWTSTAVVTTGNLVFRNGVSSSGSLFAAAGATFNTTAAQSIGGTAAMSFIDVAVPVGITVTNSNTSTVTISATLTGAGTFTQGTTTNTLAFGGATIGITAFNATGANNTVNYTAAAPTIRAVNYHHLTHSGTGVVTVANISIAGNLTESSTGTFNLTGTTTFNGTTAAQNITGPGIITFASVTLTTGSTFNVNVNNSISISGVLNFSAANARLLVVVANTNVTLGNAATITNFDADSYVRLNGSTGPNSNLIKTSNGTTASWQITYPIGTNSGGYTPIVFGTVGGAAPTNGATIAVKAIYNNSNQGQLRRQHRIVIAGNLAATTFAGPQFSYNTTTDLSTGDALSNYSTIWHLSEATGSWTSPGGTAPGAGTFTVTTPSHNLVTGTYYYTIGQISSYPNTWYSYQTGAWSNWQNWTRDPSGSSLVNPLNLPPQPGDEIVILNGITITNDVNTQVVSNTIINGGGTLDMSTTTGNNLGIVSGTGTLRINGVALPTGTYTSFVSTLGGTVEYYNTGGTLSTTQTTYNNLRMTATAGAPVFIMASNLIVNGSFDITTTGGTATWQINNATAAQRTITLNGNLTVGSGGIISVGTGNEAATTPHIMTVLGNITNNGVINFFDATDTELDVANYGNTTAAVAVNIYSNELQGNAVTITFSGATDNIVTCNNTTNFYRFVVNKGTGQQAILTVNSSSTTNFRLFGPTNIGSAGSAPAPNEFSENSLSIINGTLQLTGFTTITNLDLTGGNNYFSIPQNGALWLNGAGVTVTVTDNNAANAAAVTKRLMLSGLLRITDGILNGGTGSGIGSEDGGAYFQEGGTVTCWQFRPRAGGTGIFSFNMINGTLNVGYNNGLNGGFDNDDFCRFDLRSSNSTFQMSGGTLNVAKPTNDDVGEGGGIWIGSSPGNTSVTLGTINVYTGLVRTGEEYPFHISSTAPIYNLNIYRESGTTTSAQLLGKAAAAGPPPIVDITGLTILNNLTLVDGTLDPIFLTTNLALNIGGNFDIQTGTTFTPGTSVVTFNGTGAQTWTHNGTITSLASVVMNKTTGATLTLAGANTFPNITTALTLTSGILADGGKTITVSGTGTLTNNATHSGAGVINYTSTTANILGSGGTFGNLTINSATATIATAGNQTVNGILRLVSNTVLNIGANNLTALGNIYSDASPGTAVAFAANKRIQTNGFHNAGGLTRQSAAGVALLFPVGSGALYTPNTITIPTATTFGTITVRPVNSEHPNVTAPTVSLNYYWRVTSAGFTGLGSTVTHSNYNFSTATQSGTTTTYRAARYDRTLNNWSYHNTAQTMTGNIIQPNPFNTGTNWTLGAGVSGDQLDGEYTCGNVGAFGTVTVYYSKASGAWNLTTTWSNTDHAGADAATAPPCATCPVVIGDGGTFNHTVTTVAASSCGSLALNSGSTLDCSTFTGHNFGTGADGVSGRGTLRIAAVGAGVANMFPAGDFSGFIGANGGTVEWYGATKTIPVTGPAPQNLSLATYYNLVLNPSAANTITLPASNLTIYNNVTQGSSIGFTGTAVTNGIRTVNVTGNLTVSSGTFSVASATTLTVGGNSQVDLGATWSTTVAAGTSTLSTPGSITNNGTINFNNTGVVNITFTGTNNVSFSGSGTPTTTLSLITVNKGTSQTPTITFSVPGTVNTTAVALGWLTLTNGTFDFNSTATITTSLSTTSYTIPSTARLKVTGPTNTVNITSGDADGNDLFLNGALEVAGGTVNVGNTTVNANNVDIEYASAGTPTITVSSGNLWVKSSVRRSTTTIAGALVYNQTDGTVTVGGIDSNTAPNNTRGVFEIDANPGSSFTLTGGGSLTVQRQALASGGGTYADVFINPLTSNVSATSTIAVGLTTAVTQANLRVNIAPLIGNFTVLGPGANANPQTVNLFSNPMILGGTLTITTPSVLVTNSLDVTIAGNLTIVGTGTGAGAGTYTGGTNTTTFNGTGAQTANFTAVSTFNNMTINKTTGTTLTLSGTSPTLNNLNILSGILDVGALALNVNGNVTNNSFQVGTGSIVMAGAATAQTVFSSNGSFTNLSLGGTAASKVVTLTGNTTVNGVLDFTASGTNRYFFIGTNQLSFGTVATIANAGTNRFIRTDGISSDLGVLKNWPVGTNSFTYAVGTRTNYTPVTITSLVVSTAGSYTVVPVDSQHPTASPTGEQLLSYYWSLKKGSTLVHGATGSVAYQVPTGLIGGSGGTLVGSYLDAINPTGWTSAGGFTVTPPNTILTFTGTLNTFLPGVNGQFDYTYGTTNTLPASIGPVYSRFADADGISNPTTVNNLGLGGGWATAANWTLSSTGNGAPLGSAPTSRPVVILPGARINLDILGQNAFSTQLSGLLVVSTTGHDLGAINGTGTMRTTVSTLPAGNYTTFTAAGGGTIEYAAAIPMNSRSTYNNLLVSSAGVTMTNTNLILNGNLAIGTGSSLTNTFGNNIGVAGNWTNDGTFNAGTGGTVTLNSTTAAQTIGGTSSTTFYGLGFNNTSGTAPQITLGTNISAATVLNMTSGRVNLTGNTFTLGTSGAASTLTRTASTTTNWMYGGTVCRFWPTATTISSTTGNLYGLYPVGAATPSSYRPVEINSSVSPTATGSYCVTHIDATTTTDLSPVYDDAGTNIVRKHNAQFVTSSTVTGGTYSIGVTMTGLAAGTLSDIRLAVNSGATTVTNVGTHVPATGTATNPSAARSGASLADIIGDFRITTTNLSATPLPVELTYFNAVLKNSVVDLSWSTASELNNDFFTVERSESGEKFEEIKTVDGKGTTSLVSRYSVVDEDPLPGVSYYRLMQTDFDGNHSFSDVRVVENNNISSQFRIYPNPIAESKFTFEMNGLAGGAEVPLSIINMQGVVVHQSSYQASPFGTLKATVTLNEIPSGIYMAVVDASRGVRKKIVIP